MGVFKTKNGEIFNLDDFSRIVKDYFDNSKKEWIYVIVPKGYVNTGNSTCSVCIDKEEYDILVNYFKERYMACDIIGYWGDNDKED